MGNTPSGHITTLSTDRTSGTVVVTKDKSHFQTMTNDCPSREGYTFAGWYTDLEYKDIFKFGSERSVFYVMD